MKNTQNLQKKHGFLIKSETYEAIINKYKNKYFNKINHNNFTKISHIKISNNKAKKTLFFAKNQAKSETLQIRDLAKNYKKHTKIIRFKSMLG